MTSLLLNVRDEYRVCKQLLWPARARRWVLFAVTAIVLAALAIAGIGWALTVTFDLPANLTRGIGFFIAAALATGWIAGAVALALSQNRPAFAVLVPGLHRRLLRLLGAQVVLCSVLVAGVFGLLFGQFGPALVLTGLAANWLLLMKRYPLLLVTSIGFAVALFFRGLQADFVLAPGWLDTPGVTGNSLPVILLALVFDLLLLRLALHKLLPKTQNAQRLASAPGARWMALRGGDTERATTARGGAVWPWRRHGSQGTAMLRALGRGIERGGNVGATTVVTLLILVVIVLLLRDLHHTLFISMVWSMLAMLLFAPRMYAEQVRLAIAATGAEQDLYQLTPLAPSTPAFRRVLHTALLLRFALLWLVVSGAALCLVALTGTDIGAVMDAVLLLAALALPGARHLLRDYPQLRAGSTASRWSLSVATGIWTGSCIFFLNIARDAPGLPWRWCAALVAALAVADLYRRWRALVRR